MNLKIAQGNPNTGIEIALRQGPIFLESLLLCGHVGESGQRVSLPPARAEAGLLLVHSSYTPPIPGYTPSSTLVTCPGLSLARTTILSPSSDSLAAVAAYTQSILLGWRMALPSSSSEPSALTMETCTCVT